MALSPYEPLAQVYADLLRLTRGMAGLRLALAEGVDRLEATGGITRLGFPSLDAFGRERLGRSGRWLADARALARRLAMLPLVRAAYLAGELSTSKAELVARRLVRGGDVDEASQRQAIEQASALTVRQLRSLSGAACDEDGVRHRVQLTRHVDRVEATAFEGAILMLQSLGATSRTDAIEGLLAEGLSTLLNGSTQPSPDLVARLAGPWPMSQGVADVATGPVARSPLAPSVPDIGPEVPAGEGASIEELDLGVRELAAELTRRDMRLGVLAVEAERLGLAHRLGFETHDAFYRDALGIAPSSMAARIALARRIPSLPLLEAAIHNGAIGFEAATLVARVARPTAEFAWLSLAETLTVKLFRERVDAAELHARLNGLPLDRLEPPEAEHLEDARELERAVLGMVFTADSGGGSLALAVESDGPTSGVLCEAVEPSYPTGGGLNDDLPALGPVAIRLSLPEDLADFWRDLEVLHADVDDSSRTFVAFLVAAALHTWRGVSRLPAYGEIYLRDRYRCQNPTCRSRHCTPHHIVFRSHGGGEDTSNLVSLCERCHLDLVHGGHLAVTGRTPDALTWTAAAYAIRPA